MRLKNWFKGWFGNYISGFLFSQEKMNNFSWKNENAVRKQGS
jgi:hypothetical protein